MESNPVFISVRLLPADIRNVLSDVDYNKPSIGIKSAEVYQFKQPYGDGYQTFAVIINMATGEFKTYESSWGGPNPFQARRMDVDEQKHKIPVNGAVVSGQRGGTGPVSATLYVHPDNMPKYLPAGETVTDAEARILVAFRSYTSAYRKEILKRSDEPVIDGLVARGLLKRNKAGATAITDAGKNAVSGARINL